MAWPDDFWDETELDDPIATCPGTLEVTEPGVLGRFFVVRDGQAEPEEWTLLDRPPITFGFCKET